MTDIYLAYSTAGHRALQEWDWHTHPLNMLVAFPFVRQYGKLTGVQPAKTMLDSGAFSAWNSGKVVDIDALIAECKSPRWDAAVGLDVIGDPKGTVANMDYMYAQGATNAMPVFHIGDPWELLNLYAGKYPKVGLSCRFGEPTFESMKFYEQCFARAYPCKFHSFGWTDPRMLRQFPFHSADSSSWIWPMSFRQRVRIGGGVRVGTVGRGPTWDAVKGVHVNSLVEYHEMQRKMKIHWAREMARLDKL